MGSHSDEADVSAASAKQDFFRSGVWDFVWLMIVL